MRILVATIDGYSHTMQAFSVVDRLVRRGHTVRWLTHEPYRTIVERAGATLVPAICMPTHDGAGGTLDDWATMFRREAPMQRADIGDALAAEPADVVLVDPTMVGIDDVALEFPSVRYAMLGCVPLLHVPYCVGLVLQATLPDVELPVPPQVSSRVRFCGPLLPPPMDELSAEEMDAFGRIIPWGQRPVVVLTRGTVADPTPLMEPTIAALAESNVFVVAQMTPRPGLPSNVLAMPWIPFGRILPHAAALISNGGYLGAQWALAAGIPMVVAGTTEDKPDVGDRVQWAGFGISLCRYPFTGTDIARALGEVLTNPRYRREAQRLAVLASQQDSPTVACQLLEQWMEQRNARAA